MTASGVVPSRGGRDGLEGAATEAGCEVLMSTFLGVAPCGETATHRISVGCVHEHVKVLRVCAECSSGHEGADCCRQCAFGESAHECPISITVLDGAA